MPFTLSHAAAVLPLVRGDGAGRAPLLASALVAGSFAPDVPYFTDTVVRGTFGFGLVTHGLPGVVTVDVLVTAALVGVWLLVRDPLVALLPARQRGRACAFLGRGRWRRVPLPSLAWRFWLSAAVGAATHVVWDSFTHPGRAGVRLVPVLEREAADGVPLHLVLQYGGSAAALAASVWWLRRRVTGLPELPEPGGLPRLTPSAVRWSLALVATATAAGAAYRCWRWYAAFGGADFASAFVPTASFGAGSGLAGGLVLYAAAARVLPRPPTSDRPGTGRPAGTSAGSASASCRG